MSGLSRLPKGGRIDRSKPVGFWFNGRQYTGVAGDTLASALLANGVSLVARSWKYHRPRGLIAAGVDLVGLVLQTNLVYFAHQARQRPGLTGAQQL